ncbi:MAG TPA: hypothetical protein VFI76_03145, partial [Terrimicrobiaceae bacterium]|nr:hypothetical protein [Terrimicrobiaceae bacterium]
PPAWVKPSPPLSKGSMSGRSAGHRYPNSTQEVGLERPATGKGWPLQIARAGWPRLICSTKVSALDAVARGHHLSWLWQRIGIRRREIPLAASLQRYNFNV